jgi:hypothetical protein
MKIMAGGGGITPGEEDAMIGHSSMGTDSLSKKHESLLAQVPEHLEHRGQVGFPQEVEGKALAKTGRWPGTVHHPQPFSSVGLLECR